MKGLIVINFIGIDPSTSSTGFAVVNEHQELLRCGAIKGLADDPKSFAHLYTELNQLLEAFPPDGIICETQFIGVNRATSIKLIRPTGIVLAVSGLHNAPFTFLAPSAWRKVYQGVGKWTKRDTFKFTKEKYPGTLTSFNKDNDMSDAIGIAYACSKLFQESGALDEGIV